MSSKSEKRRQKAIKVAQRKAVMIVSLMDMGLPAEVARAAATTKNRDRFLGSREWARRQQERKLAAQPPIVHTSAHPTQIDIGGPPRRRT